MDKIFPFLIFFFAATCLSAQIEFQSATVEKVKTELVSDDASGFVYVHGTWCISCQVMEETTFESEAVQDALAGKYNAYKINFDSEAGKEWASEYEICCLPTMLFFDSKGNQTQKIEAPLTSTALSKILRNSDFYNSKPVVLKTPETEEYPDGTIIMEEISFSEDNPKVTSELVANSGDSNIEIIEHQDMKSEVIQFSEQQNNATAEEKTGEFLYHLRHHIESLESLYVKYAVSAPEQVSDILSQVETPAANQKLTVTSTRKIEKKKLLNDTEMLYELIQELKDWEDRLRNSDYEIRPVLTSTTTKTSILTEALEAADATAEPGAFHVQMGYFKNENYAKRMVEELKKNYEYPIALRVDNQPKGTYHRVLLGNFKTEKEAEKVSKMMKKSGRNALLKKEGD